jgi:hypothetical protein
MAMFVSGWISAVLLASAPAAALAALLHVIPIALPFLAPGKRQAADNVYFVGKSFFIF